MLRSFTRGLAGLLLASGLLLALSAGAVPVTYIGGGTVTITVSSGATTHATVPGVPLDGAPTNFITFDAANPSIDDLLLSISGVGPIALTVPYATYTSATVHSAVVTPGTGYTGGATFGGSFPPIDFYTYNVGPLDVSGTFSATGPFPTPPIVNAPLGFSPPSLSGSLFVNTVSGSLSLLGVTIGVIPAPVNSGLDDLVIKGDFFFSGVVPEPGTAILLGAGLLGLLGFGRRAAGKRS
jgi:hypothetical protein